jgi:hypothetical protein
MKPHIFSWNHPPKSGSKEHISISAPRKQVLVHAFIVAIAPTKCIRSMAGIILTTAQMLMTFRAEIVKQNYFPVQAMLAECKKSSNIVHINLA